MTVQEVIEPDDNYKGLLIQYCQERGLSQPRFTETQHGTPDTPSWKVTVHYGDRVHETADPVPGAKKGAHQFAAKQVLDSINENRHRLLTGDSTTEDDDSQDDMGQNGIAQDISERLESIDPIDVSLPLVTGALTIANERLTSAQPGRYRTISDAEFSSKLAQLTMQIVRDLVKAAEEANVQFPQT